MSFLTEISPLQTPYVDWHYEKKQLDLKNSLFA